MLSTCWNKAIALFESEQALPEVSAHCDVPCGVYEPDSMMWAAETVFKMDEKLAALTPPGSGDAAAWASYENTAARMVATKEEYAQKCKKEVLILWTDYFKPEHFDKWPDLSDKVLKVTKQCSTVKRGVSTAEAQKLKDMAGEIADIFKQTKA
ncbi:MAG: superoxide dismutase, Ni [Cyanobacteria bacterium P01_D01_bin.123]